MKVIRKKVSHTRLFFNKNSNYNNFYFIYNLYNTVFQYEIESLNKSFLY